MEIFELADADEQSFKDFKEVEWQKVDQEHYSDNLPSFEVLKNIFVAKDLDEIIGQIEIKIDQGVARIESLLVGKAQQGNGVGSQLVEKVEVWALENGAHKITLETGRGWKAKEFYKKLGYEVRCVLPNDVAHQDFVLMDKMLR